MKINESGLYPSGDRVVVLPDVIEETTEGGIVIPEFHRKRHQLAQATGRLIAVGPDAWRDGTETTHRMIDGTLQLFETRTWGYSGPFADVGDRVCFAKYNGLQFDGEDGKSYRLLNDTDITAVVSDGVDFSDMKLREPVGVK